MDGYPVGISVNCLMGLNPILASFLVTVGGYFGVFFVFKGGTGWYCVG